MSERSSQFVSELGEIPITNKIPLRILYLTSRLPIPPLVRGDTLRDFYIIKELASRGHKVILVSFYRKDEINDPNLEILKKYCQEINLVQFDAIRQSINLMKGLYCSVPFQTVLYFSKVFQNIVDNLILQEKFDVAYIHFARLAHFLNIYNVPKVIDLQDSFEKNMWDRYLREKNILIKIIAFIESKRMKSYEKQISQDFSYATVVSERDLNSDHQNVFVVSNGIRNLQIIQERNREANGLLFMGLMSYFANEDAALFLINEIMPIISRKIPDLKLYIVGYEPSKKLRRHNSENVIVTGFVPDMFPYLAKSRIVVTPLRYATGIQNKVLETMFVGIPQIVSRIAAEGFRNLSGEEFLTSECEKEEFSAKILNLWDDFNLQDKLVENGREYVLDNYSWDKSVSILEKLFQMSLEQTLSE